jgi:hypothetical protein
VRTGQSQKMRREEEGNASANGTIRQEVLAELEKTRNLFELMISSGYMVIAGQTVGKMLDADRVC